MKTDEMNDKIDAIDINAISKKIPKDCKILVIKVKDKLAEFFLNADFFKQVQEEASDIEKPFKKSGKIVGADKFDNFYKYIPLFEKFQAKLESDKSDNIKKLLEYFKEFGEKAVQEQKRNEIQCTYEERSTFFENVEKLEKECREAKQEFKDKFEKVYKSLKSFIKKLEKRNSSKGIKEVAKSEIDDFKKYGIDLDKIINKIDK